MDHDSNKDDVMNFWNESKYDIRFKAFKNDIFLLNLVPGQFISF